MPAPSTQPKIAQQSPPLAEAPFFLPHELAFLALFVSTGLRLALVGQTRLALPFAALSVAVVTLAYWTRRHSSSTRTRLRLLTYVPLMMVSYFLLGQCAGFIKLTDAHWLQRMDNWFIRTNASLWMERLTGPMLSDLFSFLYLGFFIYMWSALWHYSRRQLKVFQAFMAGLFVVYGVGFLGYTIVSAAGPYLEMAQQFSRPIQGGRITDAYNAIVLPGTNRTDCFPCLHVAVSAFILFFDLRHSLRRFLWMMLPCAGIWFSTLYLRQHYFTDIVGGVILTGVALWISARSLNSSSSSIH